MSWRVTVQSLGSQRRLRCSQGQRKRERWPNHPRQILKQRNRFYESLPDARQTWTGDMVRGKLSKEAQGEPCSELPICTHKFPCNHCPVGICGILLRERLGFQRSQTHPPPPLIPPPIIQVTEQMCPAHRNGFLQPTSILQPPWERD